MNPCSGLIGLAFVTVAAGAPALSAQAVTSDATTAAVQRRVEAGSATGEFWAAGQRLTAVRSLPTFYRARAFRPAWLRDGRVAPLLGGLIEAIEDVRHDGLDPHDYHLDTLRALRERVALAPEVDDLVDLDLLATDAFLVLGSHLLHGRVDPVRVRAEWLADRRNADMPAALEEALEVGDVGAALDRLRPRQARYRSMRDALTALRRIEEAGGWPTVEAGPTLRVGDVDARVPVLRRRLAASGDLPAPPTDTSTTFDAPLEEAVRTFQARHGLDVDGAVGNATREALNVPVGRRIAQLVVNLERWRWMPDDLGATHVLVNIPDFSVTVRENGEAVFRTRAVVGRQYRQTPVFSGRMTYLVFSPYWHVPPGIAANDKFPELVRNPGYVADQRMTLLDIRTNERIDPHAVDWSGMSAGQFNQRYRLRQEPGPTNALGDVKFMFPNPHNVYLHDTPSRELFARTERGFSSGCIRIEHPFELARYLLRANPAWTPERIRSAMAAGSETTVTLPAPVPVHLQYWTAFVDDEGRLNHRRDIYERDAAVRAALTADPPGA